VARKKSAVALMADGKKDSVKGNTQAQGKAAPAMAAASDNSAAINIMTEFLNEIALQNGASAEWSICNLGAWYARVWAWVLRSRGGDYGRGGSGEYSRDRGREY
jgi:hypothetical protein